MASGFSMISQLTLASESTVATLQSLSITSSVDKPPPLLPQVKKCESSLSGTGELFPICQHPDAPFLPPREGAPLLPPRHNDLVHTQTLPCNTGLT